MMIQRLTCAFATILMAMFVLHAQQAGSKPFSEFERELKNEPAGWSGNKGRLSTFFDAERRQLGDRFETELLKWIGNDPEKHDWVSIFIESESYLHGNRPLPHLALLLKHQGLALVRGQDDEESRRRTVRLSITAAILSSELGFATLASSHKNEAEVLLARHADLSTSIPGFADADRKRYDEIKSVVSRTTPTVTADLNPAPKATISGGVLNAGALKNVKPSYPADARKARASGTVEVRVVIDETGKVIWARAISGHPLLRQAAEDAAWQTKFSITKLSGQPVKVAGILLYNFAP